MPETSEISAPSEPTGTVERPAGGSKPAPMAESAPNPSVDFPDLTPLMDAAEQRITFFMDTCENSLRSTMLVSAAGLECGTIWTRGCREIGEVASNGLWRTGQTAVEASGRFVDSWMNVNIQVAELTVARLTEAA